MKQLAIFASGSGTNAENIARLFHQGNRIRVSVVLCNRKEAGVYSRMEALGVPVIYIPNSAWDNDPERVIETLKPYAPDLVVLAGFMKAVRPEIVSAFSGRMVNIHPSLLPAYGGKGMYGHHVHEAVIAAGETRSGVSVHYVTDVMDGGEIIMQQEVEVLPEDTAETLEAKIHQVEYDLYPRAIVKALGNPKEEPVSQIKPDVIDPEPVSGPASVPPVPAGGHEAQASVDEDWARTLHINYSDKEAERARARIEEQQTPPPIAKDVRPGQPRPLASMHPVVAEAVSNGVELPKSYMWVSVVMAVLFSTIPGIVAIVYSASVSSRLSQGDIKGAARASRNAQGWIIASFVIGVLSATLWLPLSIISGL